VRAAAERRLERDGRRALVRRVLAATHLPTRVFISFDFSHMHFEARALGQQLLQSSRFHVQNWSMKEAAPERLWPAEARNRLNRSDVMVVVVNGDSWRAHGVRVEVQIANALGVPIRQLYPARCVRPRRVPAPRAPLTKWTHANLERHLRVPRRRAA
jgi:hypothetical protein